MDTRNLRGQHSSTSSTILFPSRARMSSLWHVISDVRMPSYRSQVSRDWQYDSRITRDIRCPVVPACRSHVSSDLQYGFRIRLERCSETIWLHLYFAACVSKFFFLITFYISVALVGIACEHQWLKIGTRTNYAAYSTRTLSQHLSLLAHGSHSSTSRRPFSVGVSTSKQTSSELVPSLVAPSSRHRTTEKSLMSTWQTSQPTEEQSLKGLDQAMQSLSVKASSLAATQTSSTTKSSSVKSSNAKASSRGNTRQRREPSTTKSASSKHYPSYIIGAHSMTIFIG